MRENEEELQQNSAGKGEVLGVGGGCWSCQGLPSQGSLAFILQPRQRNFNTAERSVKTKAVFSLSVQNKTLHSGR